MVTSFSEWATTAYGHTHISGKIYIEKQSMTTMDILPIEVNKNNTNLEHH
jgi:hypothetical protein